jgi:hypothetical protein
MDLTLGEHQRRGFWRWNRKEIGLYRSQTQHSGTINGYQLIQQMASFIPCNANVVEFLLTNFQCIPTWWKQRQESILVPVGYPRSKKILFFGTTFDHRLTRNMYVRSIFWNEAHHRYEGGYEPVATKFEPDVLCAVFVRQGGRDDLPAVAYGSTMMETITDKEQ